jgi:hypothetical protein
MLPVIAWSAATVIVPLPVALVVTGGTSWLPLSVTLASTAEATLAPIATRIAITPVIAKSVRLMVCLLLVLIKSSLTSNLRPTPHGSKGCTWQIVKSSPAWGSAQRGGEQASRSRKKLLDPALFVGSRFDLIGSEAPRTPDIGGKAKTSDLGKAIAESV